MLDKPKQEKIEEQLNKWFHTFYYGDKLTALEQDIEGQYLVQKFQKMTAYKSKALTKNKTVWTVSDLNRYQDQENYRMCDPEYFGNSRPIFKLFDLDKALEMIPVYQDILQVNKLRRAISWFKD